MKTFEEILAENFPHTMKKDQIRDKKNYCKPQAGSI